MREIILQNIILPLLGKLGELIVRDEHKRYKRGQARFERCLAKIDFEEIAKFEEIELVDLVIDSQNQYYLDGGDNPDGFGSYILLEDGDISLRFQNLNHIFIDKTSEEYWKLSGKFGVTRLGSDRPNLQLLLTPKV